MENAFIKIKKGTALEAAKWNGVLEKYEVGYETDTGLKKIGDGKTPYKELKYSPDLRQVSLILPDNEYSETSRFLGISIDGVTLTGKGTTDDPLVAHNDLSSVIKKEIPNGLIDGTNNIFTTQYSFIVSSLEVMLNGLNCFETIDYTITGDNEFTFNYLIKANQSVRVNYIKA